MDIINNDLFFKNNRVSFKRRVTELLWDYVFILSYLILVFVITMAIYLVFFNGIPKLSEIQSQGLVFITSVLPVIFIFSYMDFAKNGSLGKRKAKLKLVHEKNSITASLVRNVVKFLPWQLAHIGVIHGVYSSFDTLSLVLINLSIILGLVLIFMAFFRKDKRHLGDLLAHTQVQSKD